MMISSVTVMQMNNYISDIAFDFDDIKQIKTYVKVLMLHINGFRRELNRVNNIILSYNLPDNPSEQISFLKQLSNYEKEHEYNYSNSTYKAICGIQLELLLPRKIRTVNQKRKLINRFIKRINPIGYKIPILAYEEKRGSASYIKILLNEREFINHTEAKTYDRNYYDKHGNITHKKGEIMLDKNGNQVMQHVLWSKKTRLFTINKQNFKRITQQLIDHYVEAVKSIIDKINTRFRIRKKAAKGQWHYFNRKVCTEINVTKQYVEFYCNHAVMKQKQAHQNPWYEQHRGKAAPVPKIKEIIALFHKFKNRFEKQSFHDKDGILRNIAYKHVPLPELQQNLDILKQEFKNELVSIIPNSIN